MKMPEVASQIVVPRTAMVGREEDVEAVVALLRDPQVPLLSLTGPGGTGKTRLAVEAASRAAAAFGDGARAVSLAEVIGPDLVLPAIARSVGVTGTGRGPLIDRVVSTLRQASLLLFLDNFEHVAPAAPVVDAILSRCPGVRCLVTSRIPLHLECEQEFPVDTLPVPPDRPPASVEELRSHAAVRLFGERAARVVPGFTITMDNAAAIAEICRGLDGLPLAIELAAARMKVLTPEAFVARMEHRLLLLTGGSRDHPARQRSLTSTIAWSYELLSPAEQRAFRLSAVFAGGFGLEAAESVFACAVEDTRSHPLDLAQALVEASLVRRHAIDGTVRFSLLQTVREHALALLASSDDRQGAHQAHLSHYLGLARRAAPELEGPNQGKWFHILESELPNLRAAFHHALETGQHERALELSVALGRFWEVRGYLAEGRHWLAAALARDTAGPDGLRARALAAAGTLARSAGDYDTALLNLSEALRVALSEGDSSQAARVLFEISQVAHYKGDFDRMFDACVESLRLYREVDDRRGIAVASGMQGHGAWHLGELQQARELIAESLVTWRELGDGISIGWALWDLGNIALDAGDLRSAHADYREALELAYRLGEMQQFAALLEALASLAARQHDAVGAARLAGAAKRVRDDHGITLPVPYVRDIHAPLLASLRAQLPSALFEEAYAAGRALSPDASYEEALAAPGETAAQANPTALTHREQEILRLIASGRSNQEIAAALVLSVRTVERHALNVYQKLGLHGPTARAGAAAHAWEHGYCGPAAAS